MRRSRAHSIAWCWSVTCVVSVCLGGGPSLPGAEPSRPWNFENDIVPILSRYGCNTSGCHGKAEGQNGFKLSVFGFDPDADYAAIVREGRGRRVFPAVAEQSLLLTKASGRVPHGGGIRLRPEHPEYQRLRDWIAAGLPFGSAADPQLVRIEVTPAERQLRPLEAVPLKVTATWTDGRTEDVTALATFQSNSEALATVDDHGIVTAGTAPGGFAVLASYLGRVDIFEALIPRTESLNDVERERLAAARTATSPLDRLIAERLTQLNIAPAERCDDATFLRRVSLDLVGTLPTSAEARAFLADTSADRRERLVDRLLERPEFADLQALRWADLLHVNRRVLGRKGALAYYNWIHARMAENQPLDRFVAELLTAQGPLSEAPAGYFFKAVPDAHEQTNAVAQVFLGVRMECARCHHHPWDRWGQTDYLGLQGYFTQTAFKKTDAGEALGDLREVVTKHPRTGATVFAHPLGVEEPSTQPAGVRRLELARWLTAAENPWFARNLANRFWAQLMGRGLVEPVDDFRLTNPASNPALLDALAEQLVADGFDARRFMKRIVLAEAYQRSAVPTPSNSADEQNFSRYPFKRIDAEVLYDAVCTVTGVADEYPAMPAGTRAIQLWDSHVSHDFLSLFGRPVRETACQCERVVEPTVGQVLHGLNSPALHDKLRHAEGRVARLIRSQPDNDRVIEELYLLCYARRPTREELDAAREHFAKTRERREAAEDLAWSLMNTLEFLFNH